MADLVVGDDALFLVGHDGVLLLIARNDDLNALLEVRLRGKAAAVAHGAKRRFIDDVCKLRAGSAARHTRDLVEVDVLGDLDLFGVNLQDLLAALEVGQLHRHAAVKAAGARERRVEGLGAVRRGEDDDAGVSFEAVHLGQQLVERLLTLVVAAHLAVALFADGVDLVDKDDTGRLLLRLTEQVAHLARAHADEHLDEFRAGHGEERDVRLTGDGLGEHRFAGTRRADEQDALGHGRADFLILAGIMQIVDDLGEVLLRLVLAGDVVELDALGGLDIDLGVGLAHVEHHRVAAAHLLHHAAREELADEDKHEQRHDPGEDAREHGGLLDLLAGGGDARRQQTRDEVVVRHHGRFIDGGAVGFRKEDAVVLLLDLHLADLAVFGHGDEGVVVHVLNPVLGHPRHGEEVEQQQKHQHEDVVKQQGLFGGFHFIHTDSSVSFGDWD